MYFHIRACPSPLSRRDYETSKLEYEICTSGLRLSSVPAIMLLELPTIIGFAENQLS